MDAERIYIGGLNPPRLSGRDILRRLQSLDQIEIGNNEEYSDCDDRPYLHITAISKHDSNSALSIIHKQYHNVKWKGCKLVVQVAKPHFLDRLEQERREHAARTKPSPSIAMTCMDEYQGTNTQTAFNRIPRRLRIRKKHGDVAVHVDTTPWTVTSWSRFNHARSKQKKREENHQANIEALEKDSLSMPLMNRAVHIRFLTEGNTNGNENIRFSPDESNMDTAEMTISSEESSLVSSSSDTGRELSNEWIEKNTNSSKNLPQQRYEWSDDDSESEKGEHIRRFDSQNEDLNKISSDAEKNEYNMDSDNGGDKVRHVSSSKDDQGYDFVTELEDKPAFVYNDNKDQLREYTGSVHDQGQNEIDETDLISDVATNLNILSSIFPGMANAKPVDPDSENISNLTNENKSLSLDTKKTNHVDGIMPRYDPNTKSSKKYVVDDEKTEQNEALIPAKNDLSDDKSDDKSIDGDNCSTNIEAAKQRETDNSTPSVSNIYEQGKLESVFRAARDAWRLEHSHTTSSDIISKFPSSSLVENAVDSGSNFNDKGSDTLKNEKASKGDPSKNSFAFSFDLPDQDQRGDTQPTSEGGPAKNSFTFSFNVPDQDRREVNQRIVATEKTTTEHYDTQYKQNDGTEDLKAGNNTHVVRRQKGLALPDQDLQEYVDFFWGCNGGFRIIENPQEFMNSDKEKAEWKSERQNLTLDWKRKRKYAITRIQKKIKVQRR